MVCPEVPSSNLEFNDTRVKPYSNSCKEVFFNRWTLKGIKVTFKTRSERFSKTLESSNTIAIATVGDWAKKDLAPVFQPMRSKTKTNRPFNSCVLSCLAFVWKWGWCWPCYDRNLPAILMLMMLFVFVRFLSKQGQHQPHFHSRARQLSTKL